MACCQPRAEQKVVLLGDSPEATSIEQQSPLPQQVPAVRSTWANDAVAALAPPELAGLEGPTLLSTAYASEQVRVLLQEHQERLQKSLADYDRLQEARFEQLREILAAPSTAATTASSAAPTPPPPPPRTSFHQKQKQNVHTDDRASVNTHVDQKASGIIKTAPSEGSEEKVTEKRLSTVLPNREMLKFQIRERLKEPKHNVTDFYKDEGWAQRIARSKLFDNVTLTVIGINALWIAYEVDNNTAETLFKDCDPGFVVVELLFCAYFFGEWLIRFLAFRIKRDGMKDFWFKFDTLLVFSMLFETLFVNALLAIFASIGDGMAGFKNASLLRIFRLLRLTRMARMTRLLRTCPEIMILVKGMFVATRTVISSLALLVIVVYFFAIACTMMAKDTGAESLFPKVLISMYNLTVDGIFPDNASILNGSFDASWMLAIAVFVFLLLSVVTVMNLLVGVLVEAIQCVGSAEKEQVLVDYVQDKLANLLEKMDGDGDKTLCKHEFVDLLQQHDAIRAIQEVGVDVIALVDFTDHLFSDGKEAIPFHDFMELLLQLRGTNACTVKDIIDLRKTMMREFSMLRDVGEPGNFEDMEEATEDNAPADGETMKGYAIRT